ncbi:hypothetical protein Syun_027650 [Stephania yunnanensis]|uniref:Cytochrome C biogenesis protein transmembrane domain-containing protein n=1 Tax=Stephania yunnanensis TaxID=152371 RepID=A0AAP0EPV2_9MAGN
MCKTGATTEQLLWRNREFQLGENRQKIHRPCMPEFSVGHLGEAYEELWDLVVELHSPSLFNNFDPHAVVANLSSSVQAYLAGLTFALAASPCSTPVLAFILGYVAASRDPVIGGSLLLTYTTDYIAPLFLAASFAGAL